MKHPLRISRISFFATLLTLAGMLVAFFPLDSRTLVGKVFARKAAVNLEAGSPTVVTDSDNVMIVSLPIFNRGDGIATEVQITAISLGSAPRLSPFSLPVVLGDIAAGNSSVIAAGFNSAELQVSRVRNSRAYPLTVQGHYRSGNGVLDFTLSSEILIRPASPIRRVINRTDASVSSRSEVLNIPDVVQLDLSENDARPPMRFSLEQVVSPTETHFFQESVRSGSGLPVAAESFIKITASQPVTGSMGVCVRVPSEVLNALAPGARPELYVFVANRTETEDSGEYVPLDAAFDRQRGELIAPLSTRHFYPAEMPDTQVSGLLSQQASSEVVANVRVAVSRTENSNPSVTATFTAPSSNPVEVAADGTVDLSGTIEISTPTVTLQNPTDYGGLYDPSLNDGDTRFSENHNGVDLRSADGNPVYAAAAGEVLEVGVQVLPGHPRCNPDVQRGGGQFVRIRHADGSITSYAHLQEGSVLVSAGRPVAARQQIARAGHSGGVCAQPGSTGAHLHFSYRVSGTMVDPFPFFRAPSEFAGQSVAELLAPQLLGQLSVVTYVNTSVIKTTRQLVTQSRVSYNARLDSNTLGGLVPMQPNSLTVRVEDDLGQVVKQVYAGQLRITGPCLVQVIPTSKNYPIGGAVCETAFDKVCEELEVRAPAGCAWQASSLSPEMIGIVPETAQGVGPGKIKYSVYPSGLKFSRFGSIKVSSRSLFTVFTATQDGECDYSLSSERFYFTAVGGEGRSLVSTSSQCSWGSEVREDARGWLSIDSGSGIGNSQIKFTAKPNTSSAERQGVILIGGAGGVKSNKSITVTQAGTCSYSLSPQSASVGSGAGGGSFSVSAGNGCTWRAASSANWLTIASGANGNGNGSVIFNYAPNTGTSARDATITVAGKPFTLTQAAACSYSLTPMTASVGSGPGGGSVSVTATSGCTWTATSSPAWLTIASGGNGTGNGTVVFNYAANNSNSTRTGTISVADKTFTLTQAPAACTYSIAPEASNAGSGAGGGSINVTAPIGCTWTATSSSSWLTIVSGNSGSSNGSVIFNYSANTDSNTRTATIAVAGKTFTLIQAAACSYSLNPTTASVGNGAGGGSVSVSVAASSGCAWTATSSAGWLTIVSGSSGSGNGSVVFNHSANPDSSARIATITVMGKTFTLTQAAACSYTLNPTTASVGNGAGGGSVNVTAANGCAWTASSSASWLTIVSGSSGTGNGSIIFNHSANSQPSTRTATISAGGKTFTLTQAAACTYSLSSTSTSVGNGLGAGNFSVSAPSGCSWTPRSSASWLSVTAGSSGGSGNGTVGYAYITNYDPTPRTATITVADKTFTVTQAAACNYTLNPTTASVGNGAGGGSVSVSVASGCSWTASSNASWLFITSGFSGSGNGSVIFNYSANTQTYSRNATITVSGKTFTLTQAAACSYSLSPTNASVGNGFGTGNFSVSTGNGCSWTATTTASWLSVNTGSGNGNGYVSFSHSSNGQSTTRTATINVGDKAFTVTQAAACSYSITPSSSSVGSGAGGGSVSVSAASGCSWSASSSASWLTLPYGSSGSGNGSVVFNYSANNQSTPRTATIRIADKTFTLTQAALVCNYFLSPPAVSVGNSVGAGTFYVNVQSGCAWTAVSNASWLSIPNVPYGNGTGNGSGSVAYAHAPNTQSYSRTATITVGNQTFTVTQAAACSYSITPSSSSVGSGAGGGSVSIYTSSGCSWTASSSASWLTLPFGSSGSGNGSVTFQYGPNTSSSSRSATITIAGKVFTLTQAGR